MIEKEAVLNYLADGDDQAAAHVLSQCEFRFIYVDVLFEIGSERKWYLYDLNIEAPRQFINSKKSLKEKIESAVNECMVADDGSIRHFAWVPLVSQNPARDSVLSKRDLQDLNSDKIHKIWYKAHERIADDPDGAITMARTLVETICKHILRSENLEYSDIADLPSLYAKVANHLDISPSKQLDAPLKKMLGACHVIVDSICNLRNLAGDAHGKDADSAEPIIADAELAVNLSASMSLFLLKIWKSKGD